MLCKSGHQKRICSVVNFYTNVCLLTFDLFERREPFTQRGLLNRFEVSIFYIVSIISKYHFSVIGSYSVLMIRGSKSSAKWGLKWWFRHLINNLIYLLCLSIKHYLVEVRNGSYWLVRFEILWQHQTLWRISFVWNKIPSSV